MYAICRNDLESKIRILLLFNTKASKFFWIKEELSIHTYSGA